MSTGRADKDTTLPQTAEGTDTSTVSPALALTILFHPQLDRVGERVLLGTSCKPWVASIARNAPAFAPVRGGAGRSLDDEHVSRKPVLLSSHEDGSVDLDATGTQTKVVVGKTLVVIQRFSPREIRRGVVLLLAGHVVLLLHVVVPSSHVADGERYGLVGQSDGLRAVLNDIHAVADFKKPVLLRGPSGSGKELVARAIHRAGRRSKGPFIAVNLGAVPATIASAELFGAEKGAYTGALRRAGYFEQAQGGTLFLDEIGEAPVELQATLLRAIQDNEIQPVGADRPRTIDVRVVAATDADLEAKVQDGSFRAPLLNRLAAYQIWIPSLAERRDDVGHLLARFFEEELATVPPDRSARTGAKTGWIPASLIAELCEHDWPGNVRQLRNVVGHLVISNLSNARMAMTPAAQRLLGGSSDERSGVTPGLDEGVERTAVSPSALPLPLPLPPADMTIPGRTRKSGGEPKRQAIDLSEAEIRAALRACQWEIDAAAKHLGVARPSLYRAMSRYPAIRTARDLTVDEIHSAHREAGGDVARMAEALEVSEKALSRRVRDMGLAERG